MQSSPILVSSPNPNAEQPSLSVSRLAGFHSSRFWIIAGMMLFLVVVVVWLLATTDPGTRATVSGLGQTVAMFFATLASLWVSFRVPAGRTRWAWRVIAAAQALYFVAQVLLIVSPPTASASLANYYSVILFLAFYAVMAAGVLMIPTAPTTAARQVRLFLDVGIVVGALLGPSLVFLIIPRFLSQNPLDLIYVGYPFADLALLLVVAIQLIRGVQVTFRPSFFWLAFGMLCLVYADISYNVVTLPAFAQGANGSFGIPWIDPFWVAGNLAFCLAPLSLLVQDGEQGAWGWLETLAVRLRRLQPSRSLMQFFVLGLPVIVLFGLILLTLVDVQLAASFPLVALTLLVVLLIIVRQLLTMRDLVDARIATERAEKLDALKDQFITSVNHELRTPLMTMQGYLELLDDPEAHTTVEKRQDMLERARVACANLVHLVRSILDTRRIEQEAGDFVPEVVHLREAITTALSLIDPREADPTGRNLRVQMPGELVLWGDPTRVQQILMNLLSNAIKYSPKDAPITLAASLVTDKNTGLLGLKSSRPARQMVEISVQDQGLGIPSEQKDLLFRRFVRLPREIAGNIHGNGLGLYMCRVFAEAMGGTIWVESSGIEGEGSTFHLRLPVPAEYAQQAAPGRSESALA
jgi:signal transduction histidine kinase